MNSLRTCSNSFLLWAIQAQAFVELTPNVSALNFQGLESTVSLDNHYHVINEKGKRSIIRYKCLLRGEKVQAACSFED